MVSTWTVEARTISYIFLSPSTMTLTSYSPSGEYWGLLSISKGNEVTNVELEGSSAIFVPGVVLTI
jgi:hypothetical protein